MEYKDYYQILGVAKNADESEIKRAYRRLARQYHPDKNPGNQAAENKFKDINEAYEVLGDAQNRAKYDQLGHNYHRYRQMGGNPQDFDFSEWFGRSGQGGQRVNVDFGDLFGGGSSGGMSDFFNAIFSNGGARPTRNVGRSYDIEQTVEITLEEAYTCTTRTFSSNGEQFTAKIPAGAKTGTKVRLRGKGQAKPSSGQGDLLLGVQVRPHERFERDGQTLSVVVDVDVVTAVLGGQAKVPTLTGPVNLTIPAGTQGGQTIRLRGKGMPRLRSQNQYGDLLATINITVPQKLSDEERALYQQLAALRQD
jgi:curved DNA-binding protein